VIGRSVVIVFVVISYWLYFVKFRDLFISDLMMERNNDEISKLIDFTEKRSYMYVIRHFSGARNCDERASNFSCKFLVTVSINSFWYQFLVRVYTPFAGRINE